MPDQQPPTSRARRTAPPQRGGGGGWLILALIVAGIGAVFIFAPDVPRSIFGGASKPTSEGPEPTIAQSGGTKLGSRTVDAKTELAKPTTVQRTATEKPKTVGPEGATAKPVLPQYKDETTALDLLAQAEQAYKKFEWQKASGTARRIKPLDAKPATKVRADDIVRGADQLEGLFKDLDERDELTRNFDTHPGLVEVQLGTGMVYAVPIRSMDDRTPVDGDPIAWIKQQRSAGTVTLMIKAKKDFLPSPMPADSVGEVRRADLTKIKQEKQSDFESRLAKLKNSDMARSGLAWYDAGRFAFQNRLDERVTEMLDQALLLDPFLAKSVREDKAQTLFASMALHMTNGNRKQAELYMASISRRFTDTQHGKMARALFDGKRQEMLAAQRDSEKKRQEEFAARKQARLERAQKLEDKKEIEAITQEKHEEPEEVAARVPATQVTGDEAVADEYYAKGRQFYQQAIDAGNSGSRDDLYSKAASELGKAMQIYNVLLDKRPNDGALEEKARLCNQIRYGAMKQKRPFH